MQRIVVKLGSSVLTRGTVRLNRQRMLELTQQIASLHERGCEMIIVTSGAQMAGREQLAFPNLGKSVPAKQMLSAVGQSHLMRVYQDLFDIFDIKIAQILLTRDDLSHRKRYLNARDTLRTLIEQQIIPIVNENDTIATDEIRVGDNDNLSALVASLVDADFLIILTDQPGIFTDDPRKNPDAALISNITHISDALFESAGGAGSDIGTGGMVTKIQAAQIASRSGIQTIIASGSEDQVLPRLLDGESIGTRIDAGASPLRQPQTLAAHRPAARHPARRRWRGIGAEKRREPAAGRHPRRRRRFRARRHPGRTGAGRAGNRAGHEQLQQRRPAPDLRPLFARNQRHPWATAMATPSCTATTWRSSPDAAPAIRFATPQT